MGIKTLEYNINYEIKEFIEDYTGGSNVLELCLYKLGIRDFDEDKLDETLSSLHLLSCVEDYEVTLDQQLLIFIDQDYLDFKLNNPLAICWLGDKRLVVPVDLTVFLTA